MRQTLTIPRDPVMQNALRFLDGHNDGLEWLEEHRPGVACLMRALRGGPKTRKKLQDLPEEHWDQVFEVIASDELAPHLQASHQEVHQLFAAVKGDEEVLKHLRRHRPSFVLLAGIIRDADERSLAELGAMPINGHLAESEAADVGCLIGELHLKRGEYEKAVDAFTRALENEPTADAFEGRAMAYQALAAQDEARALTLRSASG